MKKVQILTLQSRAFAQENLFLRDMFGPLAGEVPLPMACETPETLLETLAGHLRRNQVFVLAAETEQFYALKDKLLAALGYAAYPRKHISAQSAEDTMFPVGATVFESDEFNGFALHCGKQDLIVLPLSHGLLMRQQEQVYAYARRRQLMEVSGKKSSLLRNPGHAKPTPKHGRLRAVLAATLALAVIAGSSLVTVQAVGNSRAAAPVAVAQNMLPMDATMEQLQSIALAANPAARIESMVAQVQEFSLTDFFQNSLQQFSVAEFADFLQSNLQQFDLADLADFFQDNLQLIDIAALTDFLQDSFQPLYDLVVAALDLVLPSRNEASVATTAPTTVASTAPAVITTTAAPATTARPATTASRPATRGVFNFSVAGFGHGVGMSQMGAIEFARRGWNHEQIILHYYHHSGIRLATDRNPPSHVNHGGQRIPLYEYIARITWREIGRSGSVPDEALRAQMIAAYTIAKRNNFRTTEVNQHILNASEWNTPFAQQFHGDMIALARSVRGRYISFNGSVADALYFASSPGHTASARYAWGGHEPSPYLVGGRPSPETVDRSTPSFTTEQIRSIVQDYNRRFPNNRITLGDDAGQWIRIISSCRHGFVERIQIGNRVFTGGQARMHVFGSRVLRSHNFTFTFVPN